MGKLLVIRIGDSNARGQGRYSYKNEVNGEDFKQVALLLLDMESYGISIDKAVNEYKNLKNKGWPY